MIIKHWLCAFINTSFKDCVSDDYQEVKLWLDIPLFNNKPIPKTIEDYFGFIDRELDFVERRNRRIAIKISS